MKRRSLEEFVLTYTVKGEDGSEKILVSIEDYYKRFIQPLDPRFSRYDFYNSYKGKVLCCFKNHDDKNPSLGIIPHKHLKGVKVYHCLGCNATGDVIRLHQRIQKEYHGRSLSTRDSALELCKIYGIDASEYEKVETDQEGYYERYASIDGLLEDYTIRDYSSDLINARRSFAVTGDVGMLASAVDSANVKMIATTNKWLQ